jgi:cystathionine beta-lyase
VPIATLGPEVANQTITLMAPSKTYNLAGLHCGFAIIQNSKLRRTWQTFASGLIPGVNIMGEVAALAAFRSGQEWLDQVLDYLKGNRDYIAQYIKEKLPSIRMTKMEATYLAWLDCRETGIPGNPFDFFLKEAKVALNDGVTVGRGGEGVVRLNFACQNVLTWPSTVSFALEKPRKGAAGFGLPGGSPMSGWPRSIID